MTDLEIMQGLAKLEGWTEKFGGAFIDELGIIYKPIDRWSDFGLLMEKYGVSLEYSEDENYLPEWAARMQGVHYPHVVYVICDPNPRRAGCLAIVSALGVKE